MEDKTKDIVKKLLSEGVITIQFTKVSDGSVRTMKCTTKTELLPQTELDESGAVKKPRKPNDAVQAVFDVEAQGWRSFRWESLTSYSDDLNDKIL